MPPVKNEFDDTLAVAASLLADRWLAAAPEEYTQFTKEDLASLTSKQLQAFLDKLLMAEHVPAMLVAGLDLQYELSLFTNAEVRFRWQVRWSKN